ncbi:MAG: CBS domain-containing protein [Candidatus Omnitrophota bacterium]|jgi:CBS domain-containing protein
MFEAGNIMTKEVVTVNKGTLIYEAMRLLLDKHVSGLPVVDDHNKLVGIITEKDMLRILIDTESSVNKSVADYMIKNVKSFTPEDSIVTICEFLIQNNYRRVPILEKGILVGIVSRRDIISFIVKLRSECLDKPKQ